MRDVEDLTGSNVCSQADALVVDLVLTCNQDSLADLDPELFS